MQKNIDEMLSMLLSAAKGEGKETDRSIATKFCLFAFDDIHRIAHEGVQNEEDVLLAGAAINWAVGVLGDIKDGKIKIMLVNDVE